MAQMLAVVPTTAAMIALLAGALPPAYEQPVDVQEAGRKDFDDNGQLVLKKVAVRVRLGDASFGETRDITRTTLSAKLTYQVICRHESLRGDTEQRSRTLSLVQCVIEQLGAARLVLPDGTSSEPILVRNVVPVSDTYGPVEDCWGVTVEVGGYLQLPGTNANGFVPAGGSQ